MKIINRTFILHLAVFTLIVIASGYKLLFLDGQLAYGDLAPFPETYSQAFNDYFYLWHEVSLGISRHPGYILPLIQGSLLYLLKNPILAQRLFIFSIPILSFVSMYLLLLVKYKEKASINSFFVSVFYAFGPMFFLEFIGGTVYTTLIGYAVFPLLYLLAFRLLENGKISTILLLAMLFGFIFSLNPHLIIAFCVSMILPFIYSVIKFRNFPLFNWAKLLLSGLLSFLLNPIFFLATFNIIATQNGGVSTPFTSNIQSFLGDVHYTYFWSNVINIIRIGNNFSSLGYTELTFWTIPFLISVFIVFYFSLTKKISEKSLFDLTAFPSYIAISLFIAFTHLEQTDFIFKLFPALFTFRNPAKLTYLLMMLLCILLYKTLQYLSREGRKKVDTILRFIIVTSMIAYVWPLFTGSWGLDVARKYYTIPGLYTSISSIVSNQPGRNLWLPSSHEKTSIKLVWLDRDKLESQLGLSQFSGNYYSGDVSSQINSAILGKNKALLERLLKLTQVSNVVLLKDEKSGISIDTFYNTENIKGGSRSIELTLSDLKLLEDRKLVSVYEVSNISPDVESFNSTVYSNNLSAALENSNNQSLILPIEEMPEGEGSSEQIVLKASRINPYLSVTKLRWKKSWVWPVVNTDPNSLKFKAVLIYEKLNEKLHSKGLESIDYLLWNSAKRSAEISKYELSASQILFLISEMEDKAQKVLSVLMSNQPGEDDVNYYNSFSKAYLMFKRMIENIEKVHPGLSHPKTDRLLSWIESQSCPDFCYFAEVPVSGKYKVKLSPRGEYEDGNFELKVVGENNIEQFVKLDYSKLSEGVSLDLSEGKVFFVLKTPKNKDYVNQADIWNEYKIESLELKDGNPSYISRPLLTKNDQDEKKSRSKENKSEYSEWGHRFKILKSWLPLEEYQIDMDYTMNSGGIGIALVEIIKDANGEDSRVLFNQKLFNDFVTRKDYGCTQDSDCTFHFSKKIRSSGDTVGAMVVTYSFVEDPIKYIASVDKLSVVKVENPSLSLLHNVSNVAVINNIDPSFEVSKVSPVLYKVKGFDPSGKSIVLNQSFDSGWEIYAPKNKKGMFPETQRRVATLIKRIVETVKLDKHVISLLMLDRYGKENALENLTHTVANGYANSWTFSCDLVCPEEMEIIFMGQKLLLFNIIFGMVSLVYLLIFVISYRGGK